MRLEFRGMMGTGDIHLGIINIFIVDKAMELDSS